MTNAGAVAGVIAAFMTAHCVYGSSQCVLSTQLRRNAFVPAGVLSHEQHCAFSDSNGANPDEEERLAQKQQKSRAAMVAMRGSLRSN